ncbi:MAG: hypothetical protein KDD11_18975 [Acidobacteria bacterium]|nr:hypothetical protein [Acidobacteriota bacterium]
MRPEPSLLTRSLPCALLLLLPLTAVAETMTSEQIVDRMVAAHGGLEAWASAPTVHFEDKFSSPGRDGAKPTRVTVEQGPRRAYMDVVGTDMSMGWDGEKAWGVNWKVPAPPRFFALLNYYFLDLPWMTQDPGVVLGDPGTGKLPGSDTEYLVVRMSFESGVGDSPGDYYDLYIDPESFELAGTRYIVTYKAVLPEGMTATPPHTLVYDSWEEVSGLKVPTHYTVYMDGGNIYATCTVTGWSFTEPFDEARMTPPPDAVVDTSQP